MNKDLTTKAFREIEKKIVRNSFVIEHSYAYRFRNMKTGDTMAY